MKKLTVLTILLAFSVYGCVTTKTTQDGSQTKGNSLFFKDVVEKINCKSITYLIPKNDTIINPSDILNKLPNYSVVDNRYSAAKIFTEFNYSNSIIKVTRSLKLKQSYGKWNSMSYISYKIKAEFSDLDTKTKIVLSPYEVKKWQHKVLIGNWEIPEFNESQLLSYLSSAMITYTLEINSQYEPDSVNANFIRKTKKQRYRIKDPVTDTISESAYVIKNRDKNVYFILKTYPYKNGTKAVIVSNFRGVQTSENEVDLEILINEIEAKFRSIVND